MTDIVIQGIGGRMGHMLCDMIAQREDCRVIAGIDLKDGDQNGIPVYDSLEKLDGKGDVVMMILRRRWEYWICAAALCKLGATIIPATLQLTKKDIAYRANAAQVKMMI